MRRLIPLLILFGCAASTTLFARRQGIRNSGTMRRPAMRFGCAMSQAR